MTPELIEERLAQIEREQAATRYGSLMQREQSFYNDISWLVSQLREARQDTARIDWIDEKSWLANGVTVERQRWNDAEREWQSAAYASVGDEQSFVSWGPKLGHAKTRETLRLALDAARQATVVPLQPAVSANPQDRTP